MAPVGLTTATTLVVVIENVLAGAMFQQGTVNVAPSAEVEPMPSNMEPVPPVHARLPAPGVPTVTGRAIVCRLVPTPDPYIGNSSKNSELEENAVAVVTSAAAPLPIRTATRLPGTNGAPEDTVVYPHVGDGVDVAAADGVTVPVGVLEGVTEGVGVTVDAADDVGVPVFAADVVGVTEDDAVEEPVAGGVPVVVGDWSAAKVEAAV